MTQDHCPIRPQMSPQLAAQLANIAAASSKRHARHADCQQYDELSLIRHIQVATSRPPPPTQQIRCTHRPTVHAGPDLYLKSSAVNGLGITVSWDMSGQNLECRHTSSIYTMMLHLPQAAPDGRQLSTRVMSRVAIRGRPCRRAGATERIDFARSASRTSGCREESCVPDSTSRAT
ncbi:hypothetical protein K466DRAFT_414008 [Polyporus arcularius HHB13444]|uniref:Uncharacterized protein n=1 Tax=Polyporus arcularius HHB13444 TaxID=1314778 RepID=A0A5C3NT45_9APHY|nr:hypothetical protein K466DRAFT_414008 [Polyporus arcularius HHB13444]